MLRPLLRTILTLSFFAITTTLTVAQSPEDPRQTMQVANENYAIGEYGAAIEQYESLLESGVAHSNLYFNLGNAYYLQGDVGQAIVNYRRAQTLAPRDRDINANLTIARAQTVDQLGASRANDLSVTRLIGEWMTLAEMAVLLLMGWFLIAIFVSLMILLPPYRKILGWATAGGVALMLLGFAILGSNIYYQQAFPAAVVVVDEVDVTEGPGEIDEFPRVFTLHAGAEVDIVDRRLGWRQVALPGELGGWVPTDAIELVIAEE